MSNIAQSPHPRQSQVLVHPSVPADEAISPMMQLRQRRAVVLAPTVRAVRGGFRVASGRRDSEYLVSRPFGPWLCTCADFQKHEAEAGFRCKHAIAVEMALAEGWLDDNDLVSAGMASALPRPQAEDAVRLKLTKNTKGYSWELSVSDENGPAALAAVKELEAQVRAEFGNTQP